MTASTARPPPSSLLVFTAVVAVAVLVLTPLPSSAAGSCGWDSRSHLASSVSCRPLNSLWSSSSSARAPLSTPLDRRRRRRPFRDSGGGTSTSASTLGGNRRALLPRQRSILQVRGGYSSSGGNDDPYGDHRGGAGGYDYGGYDDRPPPRSTSSGREDGREGDYRYNGDYRYDDGREEDDPYQPSSRYREEEEYYGSSARSGQGGYYDDDGRYYEAYDDRGYDDRGRDGRSRRSSSSRSSPFSSMPSVLRTGNKKIGMAMLAGGSAFTLLGVSLFFNKMLMRLGNVLFVAGVPMTIGPGRTAGYFLQPKKARATGCLLLGIFLVLVGHPVLGIALEVFGLLNLFGNMFPVAMAVLRQLPIVGTLLGGGGGGGNGSPRKKSRRDDYYDDRYDERGSYGREDGEGYY